MKSIIVIAVFMIATVLATNVTGERCGEAFNSDFQFITSPGWGSYGHNLDCLWNVTTSPNTDVNFRMVQFGIEPSPDCRADALLILDGQDKLLARLCGKTLPAPIRVRGNHAAVRFHTDAVGSEFGFTILMTAVPSVETTQQPIKCEVNYTFSEVDGKCVKVINEEGNDRGEDCPEGWEHYAQDNTCLRIFYDQKMTFQESRKVCSTAKSDVVTIFDDAKNKFVLDLVPDRKNVWIGVQDVQKGRNFKSLDTTALTYQAWDEDQPDNREGEENCAVMRNDGNGTGFWNDVRCDTQHFFVCEKEASVCPVEWTSDGEHRACLKVFNRSAFEDAQEFCSMAVSGQIAKIGDDERRALILGMISLGQSVWVGVQELEPGRNFQSIDGTQLTYQRWGKRQPNNRNGRQFCVIMYGRGGNKGSWNDVKCDSKRSVVCQKKASGTNGPTGS